MTNVLQENLTGILEKHFGFATFRPLQEDIIQTVLSGKDCLVVMPTGSGKSLCFQLPALCLQGVTIVISPLISLMKDQVDGLQADGISAAFLNSSQTAAEQSAVKKLFQDGDVKLLYIAPERLAVPDFQTFLSSIQVSLIAIDEAHCISEWGHEFRPDYRNLTKLRELHPEIPCIALTATATPKVREDIREQLNLKDAPVFLSSFNRENLTYHVYPKLNAFDRLLVALRKPERLPAIVYCYSRKDTESLAADLAAEGFSCLPYHAGMEAEVRRKTQEKFMQDEVDVIIATIAFGMGIDKPDVRTVIHMDLPKNIEGYYQETGRAGRDSLPSDCILFFSYGDKFKQDYFISQIEDPAQKLVAEEKLRHMMNYSELHSCRRAYLLQYFGEDYTIPSCNNCDQCLQKGEAFDATLITQKILSAVIKTGERFGMAHLCDVLQGKNSKRIRELGHEKLSVFGIVKEFSTGQLREIIGMLVEEKLLGKATGMYPILYVTDEGREFLALKKTLMLSTPREDLSVARREQQVGELPFNAELFEELRTVRRMFAERDTVAAFVIFGDRSLREMATYFPQRPETFRQIYGVSQHKLEKFGEQFLAVIKRFSTERGIAEVEIPTLLGSKKRKQERSIKRKGSTYEETQMLLRQKLPLAKIAQRRALKEGTIIQHMEAIVEAGIEIDVEYLKPVQAVIDEIAEAFQRHGMDGLSPVFHHFEGKYTYDTLRLARIFLRNEIPEPTPEQMARIEEEMQLDLARRWDEKEEMNREFLGEEHTDDAAH